MDDFFDVLLLISIAILFIVVVVGFVWVCLQIGYKIQAYGLKSILLPIWEGNNG